MTLTPAEKQQAETAIDTFLESPAVQTNISSLIATGETNGVTLIDNIIDNAKVGGVLGGVVNAFKGSAEAEIKTLVASLPPAAIAMLATKAIEGELKSLLGA
jgi:hypothetical protein